MPPARTPRGRSSASRRSFAASWPGACACAGSPRLEFRFDQSVEQHERIERIIHDIHEEEASRPAPAPDPEAPAADSDHEPHDA